uniref:Uncharacterized protein n=1 Tax=Brassica oleracea TaxID=3712 RepID=A0A3P6FTU5_BRAOL|nr:unnamed protein product [Brassica oleracea]
MHEEFTSISGYICNGLFSIGEDGFGTRRMASFCKLFGRHQDPERELVSPDQRLSMYQGRKIQKRID